MSPGLVVAKVASAGLARALEPAFLLFDGDVVFCPATGCAGVGERRP